MNQLEQVQELKQEYGIGTREALNYLRVSKENEELCDSLHKKLEGTKYKPRLREVSNIIDYTRKAIENAREI